MKRDLSGLFDSMLAVAKAAAPLVPMGPQAVAAVDKIVEMVDHAKDAFDGDTRLNDGERSQLDVLIANRDELERSVSEHVDRTAANLKG